MSGFERHEEDDGTSVVLNIQRAVSAVKRRWYVIGLSVCVITGMAVVAALMMADRYEAAAVVQIDPRHKTITNLKGIISELQASAATVESEVEVIRSRAIALKVIDILNLRSEPDFGGGKQRAGLLSRLFGAADADDAKAPQIVPPREENKPRRSHHDVAGSLRGPESPGLSEPQRDEVAMAFADRLDVSRVRNTLLIEIQFTASDAQKAAKIANTIAEVYLASQLEAKQNAAKFATRVLEKKLNALRKTVANAEHEVAAFKTKNGIYASEGQLLSEKELARLMEQTVVARNATAAAQAKYQQAKKFLDAGGGYGTLADVLESHTVRQMKDSLSRATARSAELATKYGNRHPEMQKSLAEVADARASLNREIRQLVANLKNEYEVAKHSEERLKRDLEAQKGKESLSKEASVKLNELQREAETSRQLFEALLARYKQTSETQGLQLPDARIVEQADTPLSPTGPKRKRMVILGFLIGLVGSIGVVLVLEFATTGISIPEEVELALDLDHLSSLPVVDTGGRGPIDRLTAVRLMLADPDGEFSESIRYMRREIDIRRPHDGPRVILTASSLPGEGASMVASNLAHYYAMTSGRTLLIDGDMRMGMLSRSLAPTCAAGLREVLADGIGLQQAILADNKTDLHFLPASNGQFSHHSCPELLSTVRMSSALAQLKQHFDTIIIDAPPLLPVIDGRVLADYADQIVFVMAWRTTPKQLAKKALRGLAINHGKVVGVAVNKVAEEVLADSNGTEAGRLGEMASRVRQAA